MGTILIMGGCGFIGSNLAVGLRQDGFDVTCLDNLSRRGSEILLGRVQDSGARFVRGDIRNPGDFSALAGDFDVMIECSAEPSVLVGTQGRDARFVIENNLMGSVNCFEFARERNLPVIFLSTSRVYPYSAINALRFREAYTRFEYDDNQPGVSARGISTAFGLAGARSLYGATKLASELVLQEYSHQYGLPSLIDRCGVVAGPWQLGKVDQGVFTYWLAQHYFQKPLRYIGFGGKGKQVRDVLHIDDLLALIRKQIARVQGGRGEVYNVGGSTSSSASLLEMTELCRELTGHKLDVRGDGATRPADVIWYVTDNGPTETTFDWRPQKDAKAVLADTYDWLRENEDAFRKIFA